ncbi:MAG TPA: hypothetical protein VMT19_12500 [Thermoanaerobaculaceae bacterium]|nr:hypothetical protein [Thermoanaerobaculaceae bacterium]
MTPTFTPTVTPTNTPTPTPTKTPTPTPTPTTPSGPHYAVFPAGVLLAQAADQPQLCTTWSYTLVIDQNFPSRMAVVKNVLGSSIDIITPWEPPVWPDVTNPLWDPAVTPGIATASTPAFHSAPQGPIDVAPTAVGSHYLHKYIWTVKYGSPQPDPGPPFNLYNSADPSDPTRQALQVGQQWTFRDFTTGSPTFGNALIFDANGNPFVRNNASDAIFQPHLDVVGQNRNLVNWGLEVFSTGIDYHVGDTSPGQFDKQVGVVEAMDTSDTGDVTSIENAMALVASGGQNVYGSTPTLAALAFAKTMLQDTASGTTADSTITDDLGRTFSLPPDPKLDCNRHYAAILVTDGLSNIGNPAGCTTPPGYSWGNWIEPDPCAASPSANCSCDNTATLGAYNGGPGCPDGGDSGYTCPDQYTQFAAGKAEDSWNSQVLDPATGLPKNLNVRTWVIGISQNVGPCELNYTAYRGRTDASSPNGDAGFDTAADPYLPEGSPGNYDGPTSASPCPAAGFSHVPVHGNYAFFAGSATALYNALSDVLGAYGVGNYTTSAPSIASSSVLANVGLITSAEYPGWRGHVYAYDLSGPLVCHSDGECPTVANGIGRCNTTTGACKDPDTYRLAWDAGEVMSAYDSFGHSQTPNRGLPRQIYTWDPSQLSSADKSQVLVPIEPANLVKLNTICNGCGITDQVVDFIRGNDGSGNPRRWALGAVINSTPALISSPQQWKQFSGHSSFENTYSGRNTVVWIGSSDGAIHAFDLNDGAELVALLPPDMLDLQVQLYHNYTLDPIRYNMGELKLPWQHIYGVANSPRVADIYDPSTPDHTNYRTVLYMVEGPGGQGLHAIDITHPTPPRTYADGTTYGGDPNYGYGVASYSTTNPEAAPPVMPLWSVNRTGKGGTQVLADLANTWSIPAIGGTNGGANWELVVGSGYLNYSATDLTTSNPIPHYLRLDALQGLTSGSPRADDAVSVFNTNQLAGGPWVRNQNFADAQMWSIAAGYYQPDNDVNQGVELDLQGHVWLLQRTSTSVSTWAAPQAMPDSSSVVAGDPLYYAAAIASYPSQNPAYNLYAFSSGSFYEVSSYIMGQAVGTDAAVSDPPNFIPGLFLASRTIEASPHTVIQKLNIRDLVVTNADGTKTHLGHRTQATSSPDIYVPNPGVPGKVAAVYLLFDPDASCAGESYVVVIAFNAGDLANGTLTFNAADVAAGGNSSYIVKVADAGAGAASGLGQSGTTPLASHSFAGTGGKAYFKAIEGLQISGAGNTGAPIAWWVELQ